MRLGRYRELLLALVAEWDCLRCDTCVLYSLRLPCNRTKNRYKDVICYDDTRVMLKAIPGLEVWPHSRNSIPVLLCVHVKATAEL